MASLLAKSFGRVPAFGASRPSAPCTAPVPQRVSVIAHNYTNKEGLDLSRVAEVVKHETDCGSSEVQIATLTARITQLTTHMQANRKDNSCKRGLQQILATRKRLLKYLYKVDRPSYTNLLDKFKIRSPFVDSRPATALNAGKKKKK